MADEPMYAAPVPYWALNEGERTALRATASRLEAQLRGLESRNAPWVERQRTQAELDSVNRQLASAEMDQQVERRRQQGATNEQGGTSEPVADVEVLESWQNSFGETVQRTANGLRVIAKGGATNVRKPVVEEEADFMPHPTPYYDENPTA